MNEFDFSSLSDDIIDLIDEIDDAAEDEDKDLVEELGDQLIESDIDVESVCISKLSEHVMDGEEEMTVGWTNIALKAKIDPFKILLEGLAHGMSLIGDKYEKGEAFVPQLMISSTAMYSGMDVLSPYLKNNDSSSERHVVVIGTVEGDVHDIGKNLVKTLLSANGFDCIDLGNDVPAEDYIKAVKKHNAVAVSMSTLMTTTMSEMPKVIQLITDAGLREKTFVMVGGAPITQDFAKKIKADVSPKDATLAAAWLKEKTNKN